MNTLIFTDIHENKEQLNAILEAAQDENIDFLICCGDISNFGSGLKYNLKKLNEIGKPVYIVPGNHEEGSFETAIQSYPNCINLHEKAIQVGDIVILGHGYGGFAQKDAQFRKIAREWYGKYNGNKIVLVTHMPPQGCKLDKLEMGHVGNIDYRRFIERIKPKLAISGHLHETFGAIEKIGKTIFVNPGAQGKVIEIK